MNRPAVQTVRDFSDFWILFDAAHMPTKMGCVRGLRSWWMKKNCEWEPQVQVLHVLIAMLMREYIFFLEMSNCKRQSRTESFLQIENRRREQHSELAVNKSSKATWFLSLFIRQAKRDIFLIHNGFPSWKLLVISLNFEESSATNKAHSSVAGIFQCP